VKVEIFFIVKTYSNGLTKIESGPYYSHMDALIDKEKQIFHPFENDYGIAKTELEMELV
jgi:hypothetical protein